MEIRQLLNVHQNGQVPIHRPQGAGQLCNLSEAEEVS